MPEYLFHGKSLVYGPQLAQIVRQRVSAVPEDELLDAAEPVLVAELVEDIAGTELQLRWDDAYSEGAREASMQMRAWDETLEVPATRLTVRVPFSGDPELFHVQPSQWTTRRPEGTVDAARSELLVTLTTQNPSPEGAKSFLEGARRELEQYLNWVNQDVRKQREEVAQQAQSEVSARKARILQARGLEAALGLPVRPVGSAATYALPVRPNRLRIGRPPAHGSFRPEPALDLAMYEDILQLVQNFRSMLERTPGTFVKLSEEELRDHLLLILNANYSGAAAGEVFNGKGKTDILLRYEDRNVFIAECKFWHGAKSFASAIDQLLGYLVWRDSKAALLLFIRNQGATDIILKAVEATTQHPQYISGGAGTAPEQRSDFVMRSTTDDARTLRVALIPLVVPTGQAV